ncbi:MAG: DUF433 domain-containing protein [Acidobacteriota bacterium]
MKPNKIALRQITKIYGQDPREIPAYSILQASRYLKMPFETLRSWIRGRHYPTKEGDTRYFEPVIFLPEENIPRLSFMNLVEAHVLSGMRRIENVPFYKVRHALEYLKREFPSKHPLADQLFQTDGVDLFIEHLGQIINVSRNGQMEMREVVEKYLRRIDRDFKNLPVRLYPFLKTNPTDEEPRRVVIDPLLSFGKPVLAVVGVPTEVIAERFYAHETTDQLAKDYGCTREEIEEALRYEASARRAA